jgi:secreted trypsin-like serine protease
VKKDNLRKQIIGGAAATRGQFPWQVALIMDSSSICGGSLILTNWVVSAAHCTYQRTNVSVRIGTIDYAVIPVGGYVLFTTTKFEHPGYSSTSLENDIALVKLPQHVTISGIRN